MPLHGRSPDETFCGNKYDFSTSFCFSYRKAFEGQFSTNVRYLYSSFAECGQRSSCTQFLTDPSYHLSNLAKLPSFMDYSKSRVNKLSVKGKVVNILGFVGHMFSLLHILLCLFLTPLEKCKKYSQLKGCIKTGCWLDLSPKFATSLTKSLQKWRCR